MSRFHSAVAFAALAPSLIKIQRVSAYVHAQASARLVFVSAFVRVRVCVCVVNAPQD